VSEKWTKKREDELIELAQSGDVDAQNQVIHQFIPLLYNLAVKIIPCRAGLEIDDLSRSGLATAVNLDAANAR